MTHQPPIEHCPERGFSGAHGVFNTHAWFDLLQRHGLEAPPAAVHGVPLYRSDSGDVMGVLWLMQPGRGQGGALRALGSYYTGLFGPQWHGAVDPGAVDWPRLASELLSLPGAARLQLAPLDPADGFLPALEQALTMQGCRCDRYFCFGNWFHPVAEGGFDAYWRQRPAALRHTVERARRRLQRQTPGWRVTVAQQTGDTLEAALAAYQTVYAQSWKPPEPCPGFMPELVRLAAREGWLRLGVLWLGEQPVAAQLWLVDGRVAHIYKLAYVQGAEKWSAGSVLTAALMRHVLDVDHVQEVDYGQGDEPYKRDWMTQRRERVGLLAFQLKIPRSWWPALQHFAGRWGRARRL